MTRPTGKPHPHYARLQKFVASLPETSEVEAWGHPTFRAGKPMFGSYGECEGEPSITVIQTLDQQKKHLRKKGYYKPKYVGHKGWTSMLCRQVPWKDVEPIVLDGYRQVALKRMLTALDG